MHTSLKTCFKCGGEKPLTAFYRHPMMKDGHLNKCKECTKLDAAIRAALNTDALREYEKIRSKRPDRKAKVLEYQRKMRVANPEKYRARQAVSNAIRDGRLTRKPCEICGDIKSQAHHMDYSRPLAVRWLCFTHHRALAHKQNITS